MNRFVKNVQTLGETSQSVGFKNLFRRMYVDTVGIEDGNPQRWTEAGQEYSSPGTWGKTDPERGAF